jgi:alginate O-acetyltransferase complex protein AlgI
MPPVTIAWRSYIARGRQGIFAMLFNSWVFVLLVITTMLVYYLPLPAGWQPLVLTAASFVFYAYDQPVLLALLLASILINVVTSYFVARDRVGRRRFWALLGVGLNLALLLFFKYSPLFAKTFLHDVTSPGSVGAFLTSIPLPIGISFFTFQGISLVVEVFRSDRKKSRNATEQPIVIGSFWEHLKNTALFKSFFPQLVAGPIVKAHEFYPQIGVKKFEEIEWETAFRALVLGYFLKMVIADNLADETFWLAYPYLLELSRWSLSALLIGYSMQIFADFAGYSLIAIGCARLFGYKLPVNFDFPYLSRSFTEFWRRWHISLSTWLREYLYIPLGGNRKGPVRTYFNLFVVMFLGGLWHGAAWSYALWGTFHGLALAAERFVRQRIRVKQNWFVSGLRLVTVFSFVTVAWLLFKLPNFQHVIAFGRAFARNTGQTKLIPFAWIAVWVTGVVLYYGLHVVKHEGQAWPKLQRYEFLIYGCMLCGILLNSGLRTRFIYFQF